MHTGLGYGLAIILNLRKNAERVSLIGPNKAVGKS